MFYWWWFYQTDTVELVGILWGGGATTDPRYTLFSPWANVVQDLGSMTVEFAPKSQIVSGHTARDVGVSGDGEVWTITNTAVAGGYRIERYKAGVWTSLAGAGVRISVSSSGNAWMVNATGDVYSWNNSTSTWSLMPAVPIRCT